MGLMRASQDLYGSRDGVLQRGSFSAGWLNGLVLVKLGCSHVFMNKQEISRVISTKHIWIRIILLLHLSCKCNTSLRGPVQCGPLGRQNKQTVGPKISKTPEGRMAIVRPIILSASPSQLCSSAIKNESNRRDRELWEIFPHVLLTSTFKFETEYTF